WNVPERHLAKQAETFPHRPVGPRLAQLKWKKPAAKPRLEPKPEPVEPRVRISWAPSAYCIWPVYPQEGRANEVPGLEEKYASFKGLTTAEHAGSFQGPLDLHGRGAKTLQ